MYFPRTHRCSFQEQMRPAPEKEKFMTQRKLCIQIIGISEKVFLII